MTTEDAIKHISKELREDNSYRIGWISNIAVAFCDRTYHYKRKTGKKYLTAVDIHIIANDAANDFINILTK